jgi:hypothetical protein
MTLCGILIVLILGWYTLAFVWLCWDEPRSVLLALLLLLIGAMTLRLIHPEFPHGYNDDEPNHYLNSVVAYAVDEPLRPGPDGGLIDFYSALFSAPLAPWAPVIGKRYVIRGYSIVASALSVVAMFAFCRALRMHRSASLAGATLIAVLPWTLYYGRHTVGGELVLNQLLLGTALARLIWQPTGVGLGEWLLGSGALALLVLDYWAGLTMLGWPVWAALFVSGWRRRALCLGILVTALCLSAGWWMTSPEVAHLAQSFFGRQDAQGWMLLPTIFVDPLGTLIGRLALAVQCLVPPPISEMFIYSNPWVAVHPPLVVALAGVGLLCLRPQLQIFLAGSALLGLLPGLICNLRSINWHRSLLGLPFVALFAALALNAIPPARWRVVSVVVFCAIAAILSYQIAFTPDFWMGNHPFAYDQPLPYE